MTEDSRFTRALRALATSLLTEDRRQRTAVARAARMTVFGPPSSVFKRVPNRRRSLRKLTVLSHLSSVL